MLKGDNIFFSIRAHNNKASRGKLLPCLKMKLTLNIYSSSFSGRQAAVGQRRGACASLSPLQRLCCAREVATVPFGQPAPCTQHIG